MKKIYGILASVVLLIVAVLSAYGFCTAHSESFKAHKAYVAKMEIKRISEQPKQIKSEPVSESVKVEQPTAHQCAKCDDVVRVQLLREMQTQAVKLIDNLLEIDGAEYLVVESTLEHYKSGKMSLDDMVRLIESLENIDPDGDCYDDCDYRMAKAAVDKYDKIGYYNY